MGMGQHIMIVITCTIQMMKQIMGAKMSGSQNLIDIIKWVNLKVELQPRESRSVDIITHIHLIHRPITFSQPDHQMVIMATMAAIHLEAVIRPRMIQLIVGQDIVTKIVTNNINMGTTSDCVSVRLIIIMLEMGIMISSILMMYAFRVRVNYPVAHLQPPIILIIIHHITA